MGTAPPLRRVRLGRGGVGSLNHPPLTSLGLALGSRPSRGRSGHRSGGRAQEREKNT